MNFHLFGKKDAHSKGLERLEPSAVGLNEIDELQFQCDRAKICLARIESETQVAKSHLAKIEYRTQDAISCLLASQSRICRVASSLTTLRFQHSAIEQMLQGS